MKNIIKNIVSYGLLLVPFIVFLVPESFFFPFITGKGFAFRILVEILFGLFVILAFIDSEYRPKLSWITKSILLFGGVIFLADILGMNPYKSIWSNYERMEGFVLIFHLILFYIVSSSIFQTEKSWRRFFNVTIGASLAMSVYGLFQIIGWATINQGGVRVDGTLGNAAYFAIYLVFHIFLSIYMFLDPSIKKWQRWTYAGIALLEIGILYFTATRGAILGIIGGLFVTGLLIAWKERENIYVRKIAYGTLGAILLVLALFVSFKNSAFVESSPVLSRFSSLSLDEFKTQGRYFVWPMAIKGFLERPILGWGQENFNFVFNKYYDPRMYGQEQWFDRTHNILLDWLIAGGALGLLSYLSILVALFYYIWRRGSSLSGSEKAVLTGMVLAYFFHNLFVFDNLISYIMFFSILGYIHSVNTGTKDLTRPYYTRQIGENTKNYVVIPAVSVTIILAVYFINVPAIMANVTLIESLKPQSVGGVDRNLELFKEVFDYNSFGSTEAMEQLVQVTTQVFAGAVSDTTKQNFYNFTREKVIEKVESVPTDARYLVFAGSFFNRLGRYDEAIPYLERAIKASPKKQPLFFELGTSYLGKGDVQKMFSLFKEAYELEPTSPESKIIYAVGAIYTNNTNVLNQMSKEISEDILVMDNRFLNTYANVGNYNMVISILNARIERDPTNTQYKLSLASTYANIGQKQKAIDVIQKMIDDNPDFKTQGEAYIKEIQGI